MKHDKDESSTQASTTMIDTGDNAADQQEDQDFTQNPELNAANASDDEQIVDDEDSAQRLDTFERFCKGFVRAMSLTVDDIGVTARDRQRYLDVLNDCFSNTIRLSGSVQGCQGAVNSLTNSFVSLVAHKGSQISESVAQSENQEGEQDAIDKAAKEQAKKLMEDVMQIFGKQLAFWRKTADCAKSHHQARALIKLAIKLRQATKQSLNSCSELTESVIWLGDSLLNLKNAPKAAVMQKLAKQVYASLFKGQSDAKATLLSQSDSLFAILELGLLLKDMPSDEEIISYLSEKSDSIAFNDKCLTALTNISFFQTFFESVTEETFLTKVLPAAQVASRRQETFISSMSFLVENLSFKLSLEAAKQLIPEILSVVSLETEDASVTQLLSGVCKKINDSDLEQFEAQILRNFLLKSSTDVFSDMTLSFEKKVQTINASFICIEALGDRTSTGFVNDVATTFLTLLFSDNADVSIPSATKQMFKSDKISTSEPVLAFIEQNAIKIQSATQTNLIAQMNLSSVSQSWKDTVGVAVQKTLLQQNFASTANYGQMLALMSLLNTKLDRFTEAFNSEAQLSQYITGGCSVVSQNSFLTKNPSFVDVRNHMDLIGTILFNEKVPLQKAQTRNLMNALLSYATNEDYTFRGTPVYSAFEKISLRGGAEATFAIVKALLAKQCEIFTKPVKAVVDEEGKKHQNSELQKRIVNCIKIVVEGLMTSQSDLTYEQATLILQTASHPVASPNKRSLKGCYKFLEKLLTREKMADLFKVNLDKFMEQFLKRRTGILSDDTQVRHIAKNILVMISWSGLMEPMLPQMVPIFDYKPIQMLNKMEFLLHQEFDRISHYDLMFYSEMSKDLFKLFGKRDETSTRVALHKPDQAAEEEEKKEAAAAPVEEPQVQATTEPVDLAALLRKAKKGAKDKKKAKKGKKAPAKPATASASAPASAPAQKEEAQPEMTKEERNQHDREQLLSFVEKLRQLKASHISTCQEILLWGNECELAERLNYQDKTLNFTIDKLLKLLALSVTKFSSQYFLDNLLSSNSELPFFKIKQPVITCLMAIAQDKLSFKSTQEFQNCLVFLDETANFSEMEGGYLKLTLTIANYVLKDPSVNLSVKEIGLQVTQSILDTNSEVETIDIVRLTINMLKTNYISSNLAVFIRRLMQRCSRLEIAMLLQRLFDYQPVPRKTLLMELYNFDEPLFCPVWLQTTLWVLLSDEDLSSLARKIWNKFGFYLQPEAFRLAREKEDMNMFHYLRSPNYSIFDLTVRASASAVELFQFMSSSQFVFDIMAFYDSEWKIIERLSFEACEDDMDKDQKVQMGLIGDDRINRIAVPKILDNVARLIKPEDIEQVLTFLVTKACLDNNTEIAEEAQKAAKEIIMVQGAQQASSMLATLESFIKDPNCPVDAKNQSCILLAKLAPFLEHTSAKKLQTTIEVLFELCSTVQSEVVCQSICRCIPQLSQFMGEKAKSYLMQQLTVLQETQDTTILKGTAYIVAGLFKAKGMKVLQEMETIKTFGDSYFASRKADQVRKVAALNLFETLSFSMGRSFELYLEQVFPHILSSISDQKDFVRNSAMSALKRILENFTNYAIKQALPQFLAQLETDNWRSKISTVEALGNMAYCAPKQISGFLPQIVKGLREVMNDTHEKVHEAAIDAISKIGSVIKCPEVGDMLEIIIKALSNSTKYLREALNLLLETSFVHRIDAPSLSLLVPLLDSGLMMHDNECKQMAAQLMGNICSLTSNPSDLLPYMSILMPAIKNSLFDSIPEIRASAAKAMGSLARGLGIENSQEMLGWLREHLNSHNTVASERLGAAQGFAELISAHGVAYFEVNHEEVVIKSKDEDGDAREAYRSVLLFLATSFDQFVDYLPKLVPVMIEGLADERDEVRKVSMRNVKVCIKQFGKSSPNQLVMPIMRMMFSFDSRVRASSSILMFQLVKELENDIIKAQPKYLTVDIKHQILSSMFILRHDQIDAVKSQAGQIWKSLVDNQLFILRQVIDTLIHLVFNIIQSPSQELQEMGLSCMRGLVEKFGEKLVNRALDIFEKLMDTVTSSNDTVGICRVMYNMVSASTYRLLQSISPRMISIMEDNLSCENDEIREWSTKVFITMFQRQPDKAFIEPNLDRCILYKLRAYVRENRQEDADRLILSLKYMIKHAKDLHIQDKMLKLCEINTKRDQPFSIAQAQVLGAVAPFIASKVFHKRLYTTVMTSLQDELNADVIDDRERIQHVLVAFAELMSHIPTEDVGFLFDELSRFYQECSQRSRPEFYVDFISHFCANTHCDIEAEAIMYLENVLQYMNHSDPKMVEKVISAMNAIFKKVSKETQFSFVPSIKQSIEKVCVNFVGVGSPLLENPLEARYQKKVPTLALLGFPAGVKCLVEVAQAAIMHGNIQVRTDAAYCFKYILDFAPELGKGEIVKICGALIRVANDRFPQELKLQIYQALRFIQTKGGPSAKGFQVNMQTTYTKALGDPACSMASRRVIMDNLLLLVQQLPRIDPIVKDLAALIDGQKIDGDQKTTVSECLALIIRLKGKAISSAVSQTIYKTMTSILSELNGDANDRIFSNCAAALAFLSAHSSDPAQMQTLFNHFDGDGVDAIMLPLKFAILINGNETINKSQLVDSFKALLQERLTDQAGFEEIDDDPSPIGGEDEDEVFRFKGVLDTIAFMLNNFSRRSFCQAPDSDYMKMIFKSINSSTIFKRLHEEDSISLASYKHLCHFASIVPIKTGANGQLPAECAEMFGDILKCMQKFYLDQGMALQDSQDALQNILHLNYDNYIDYSDSVEIKVLTKQMAKTAVELPHLSGVISDDMKLYAQDILNKK